ncbi:hypothetical protein EYC84_005294 [Monilinia fructicola]|uniref:histone acetyltransferase n=1 Tax=Monilinia fructicola TaxID=38448 RepID=A0A5M9JW24_MONFR|nr:hypothetical protein EYC84_005294 [Monilinia fructicola]
MVDQIEPIAKAISSLLRSELPRDKMEISTNLRKSQCDSVQGFLIVPGQDNYETRSYLPARAKVQTAQSSWTIGHPLRQISRHTDHVPPRCLVPHYPDDPKARFLDELDDEIDRGKDDASGQWKSVKTIDQFWEMMAYRQECSAGRLVGFIWIVFTPRVQQYHGEAVLGSSEMMFCLVLKHLLNRQGLPRNGRGRNCLGLSFLDSHASRPRIKNYMLERPESTAYYSWKPEGRGQVIVDEADYHRINELLLRLDFADLELASSSSKRWINEVRSGARSMSDAWGQSVTGTKVTEITNKSDGAGVTTLNIGLVRKKRKSSTEEPQEPILAANTVPQVNVLGAGMIRKKIKN